MLRYILVAGAGAALAYFLDPDRGKRRRNMTRDRLTAMLRRFGSNATRMGRRASGTAYGLRQQAGRAADIREALDDATLARKVESEIFRDPSVPKGSINVNAEEGLVVLRGEVERADQITAIEDAVRRIPDVLDVQNFLHMPGEPAPNKAEAVSAERAPRTMGSGSGSETAAEEYPRNV